MASPTRFPESTLLVFENFDPFLELGNCQVDAGVKCSEYNHAAY